MDDKELQRKAMEELLMEAKLGKERAEKLGPEGWRKPSLKVNKRFLYNTLANSVSSNKRLKVHSKADVTGQTNANIKKKSESNREEKRDTTDKQSNVTTKQGIKINLKSRSDCINKVSRTVK